MNILVVDDHPLARRGIIDILSMNKIWNDIMEADNTEDTIKILTKETVDILIVDLHLGKENGFDLIEKVRKINKQIKCVVLTSSCNYMDVKKAQQMDVDGYILKDAYIEDIIYALNVINRGEKYYSPQLLGYSTNGFEPKELKTLTDREKEVLSQLSHGLTNSQISNALYISEGTTKKHIGNILSKLNMNNRVEAVIFARRLYGN